MPARPEFEPTVPLTPGELPALASRLRVYAGTVANCDAGLYQVLMRSADWLERARPALERAARPWWGWGRRR